MTSTATTDSDGKASLDLETIKSIVRSRRRGSSSGPPVREGIELHRFYRDFGTIISNIFKTLAPIDTDTSVPCFVFRISQPDAATQPDKKVKAEKLRDIELVDAFIDDDTHVSIADSAKRLRDAESSSVDKTINRFIVDKKETIDSNIKNTIIRFIKYSNCMLSGAIKCHNDENSVNRIVDSFISNNKDVSDVKSLLQLFYNKCVLRGNSYGVIGYDIEFQEKTLLSHQFCFYMLGTRFVIILLTDERFTDESLISFIAPIVYKISGIAVKDFYIFAHFSLVEGSWIDNRHKNIILRREKMWTGRTSILDRKYAKLNEPESVPLATPTSEDDDLASDVPRVEETGKPKTKSKELRDKLSTGRVYLHFGDSKNLIPSSLKVAAKSCGFEKIELPDGVISKMADFRRDHLDEFCRYGARDAILACGIPLDIHSRFAKLGVPFSTRIGKYSELYFQQFFIDNYSDGIEDRWRSKLGQIYGWTTKGLKKGSRQAWVPNSLQRQIHKDWYHGGRNEAKQVGCFGRAYYHDLKSAYPTAVIMLCSDYNFSRSNHYWNDDAKKECDSLVKRGPFQPHAVTLFARFRDGTIPIFPVKASDGAIVFPRIFHGTVTWPEYWTARSLNILESLSIIELHTFKQEPGRAYAEEMESLLVKRQEDPQLYKSLLVNIYGKTAQGVKESVPYSSITCPALASYMTGFCRAAVGELANLNLDYYAITTDGFISPKERLDIGEFNKRVSLTLKEINYDWIGTEAIGAKSFFIKTRGYALWSDNKAQIGVQEDSKIKHQKIAAMGCQARTVKDFINEVNARKGPRKSFTTFASLKPGDITSEVSKVFSIDTTYDMKFVPVTDSMEETTFTVKNGKILDGDELENIIVNYDELYYDDDYTSDMIIDHEYDSFDDIDIIDNDEVTLKLLSFKTRALNDVYEYEHLRSLAKTFKDSSRFSETPAEEAEKHGLSASDFSNLLKSHAMSDPDIRRTLWEFRKRLARSVNVNEITWNEEDYNRLKAIDLGPIPYRDADAKVLEWLYDLELTAIKDQDRRSELKTAILIDMERCKVQLVRRPPKSDDAQQSEPKPMGSVRLPSDSAEPTPEERAQDEWIIGQTTISVSELGVIPPGLVHPPITQRKK